MYENTYSDMHAIQTNNRKNRNQLNARKEFKPETKEDKYIPANEMTTHFNLVSLQDFSNKLKAFC